VDIQCITWVNRFGFDGRQLLPLRPLPSREQSGWSGKPGRQYGFAPEWK
jgi:hypothetical protein